MIVIILGRAAQFIIALATLRAATTLLSPEEMGKVSLVITTTAFFAMFLVNPVGMFINRRLHAWQDKGKAKYYLKRYTLYLSLVAVIAALTLALLAKREWVHFEMPVMWLIALVCMSLIFNTVNQTAIPSLNMLGYSRSFVVLSVSTLVTSLIGAVVLVKVVKASAPFWLLGLLIGQTLLAIVGVKVFFSKLRSDVVQSVVPGGLQKKQLKVLIQFAWPVALAAGLAWVQGQGFRYILESQLGLAQLGLFVAGYGISAGLTAAFESVLTTYFQPGLYRDANMDHTNERGVAWRRYASAVVPSMILTTTLIILLSPDLVRLFLADRYQSTSDFVVWGALAEAARVLTGVYSLIAHVFMRTRWLVLPSAVGALVAILACLILIPLLGATGAGVALTIAGFMVVVMLHTQLVKQVGGGIPFRFIAKASTAAAILWFMETALRTALGNEGWLAMLANITLIGTIYLGALYWLLREHMLDKMKI